MEAAPISNFDHGPEPRAQGTSATEDCLYHRLALLELKRIDIFDEVDKQLLSLCSAATASVDVPPHTELPLTEVAPPIIPEIVITPRHQDWVEHKPLGARGFRAAMIAGVLLVTFGLGWFGTSNLVEFLRGQYTLTGKAAIDAVVERIISAESSGGVDTKNKRSSAAGPAQFLDETWLEMIRAYRPDLAKGRNRDQTLELRREATIAREMTTRFAERNAALLQRRGLPVTAGTIYLAHFAGGAGAVALLSAPADADAAMVMANADATGKTKRDTLVKANPFLERFTVADLKRWADRKMQGPGLILTALFSASAKK